MSDTELPPKPEFPQHDPAVETYYEWLKRWWETNGNTDYARALTRRHIEAMHRGSGRIEPMAWVERIKEIGKAALANVINDKDLSTVDIKYALRELNAQYHEPPLNRGDFLAAELRCTEQGWVALYGERTRVELGRNHVTRYAHFDSAEEALQALVKEFDRRRDEAQRQEAPEPDDAA